MVVDFETLRREDPLEVSPEESLKAFERLRQAQIRRIHDYQKLPMDSVERRNEAYYNRFLEIMRSDLRQIDHSIKLTKARLEAEE